MNPLLHLLYSALQISPHPAAESVKLRYKNREGSIDFGEQESLQLLQSDLEVLLHIFGVMFTSSPMLGEFWEISIEDRLPMKVKELEFSIPECDLKITTSDDREEVLNFEEKACSNLRLMFREVRNEA